MSEFIKKHGDSLLSDWQRLCALEQICGQLDGVITPTALRMEIQTATIAYEYCNFPAPLISQVSNPGVYWHVGRTLAKMHGTQFNIDMKSFHCGPYPLQSIDIKQKATDTIEASLPTGWFHGDFWHGNVFVLPSQEVIVIDPLPSPLIFPQRHIRASGGLDAAFMYMSIIFCLPLRDQLTININQHIKAAESFLAGYLSEKSISCQKVAQSIRYASRALAIRFIHGYPHRLPYPTSLAKKLTALGTLYLIDKKINWNTYK